MAEVRVEVPGREKPRDFVRVLRAEDKRPLYYSTLSGPWKAFEFKEGRTIDRVKVIRPDLVEIETFRTLYSG